ncbi:MAG: haloacid dehalogenase-like hydrolase [Thermodesulfobacteriota bacterium]
MILGVDFDNTIICYDSVFHKVALEQGVIPADLARHKGAVRDYLRRIGQEDIWTEMQGYVYGRRLGDCEPFPGVIPFFRTCRGNGLEVLIISHKTRHPYLGPKYDLHEAAAAWLETQGFFDPAGLNLPRASVFFELTKEEKLRRIAACDCDYFIDDLPEFLTEPDFPSQVTRLLFDPAEAYDQAPSYRRVRSWAEIQDVFGQWLGWNQRGTVV